MTIDELVTTLREEHQKLCNYTTDLDHNITGLYEPSGSIQDVKQMLKKVKHSLWAILNSYTRAIYTVKDYEEEWKEQHK